MRKGIFLGVLAVGFCEASDISGGRFTWNITNDLPQKKQNCVVGERVPLFVARSDQSECPIESIMYDLYLTDSRIAEKYGVQCNDERFLDHPLEVGLNFQFRNKDAYLNLINELKPFSGCFVYLDLENVYPLTFHFNPDNKMVNYQLISKITRYFNFTQGEANELSQATQCFLEK